MLPFPTHIDASMRSTFAACPRKFFFNYVAKRTASGTSIHLTFGGAMARALEVTRLLFWQDGRPWREALDSGIEAGLAHWNTTDTPYYFDTSPKNIETLVTAIEKYWMFFNPQEDYIVPYTYANGCKAVEFTFAIPLSADAGFPLHPETGLPILYTGRFDLLGTSKTGANFIVDDKTTSQLGMNFTKSMRLRSQFTGYRWACDQYGIPTIGVLVRATCIQKTQITFQELQENRQDHVVAQWHQQLIHDVHSMVRMWKMHKANEGSKDGGFSAWDPNLDDSCGSYGGCSYLDACMDRNPLSVINSPFYSNNNWDPLHKGPASP